MLLEFGAESIEAAAGTGSALANEFLEARESFDLTLEALKIKAGNALLPIATDFYELAAAFSGVTDGDRLLLLLSRIEDHEFSNIQDLKTSLNGIFGLFDEVESVETGNIGNMTGALESQAAYWEDYADTLEALKKRNIDPKFLSDIADGTAESLGKLKALESADSEQLNQLFEAYEAVEEAKDSTTQELMEMRLSTDETLLAMTESVEELVGSMSFGDAASANIALSESAITGQLSKLSASIGAWVSTINSQLAQMGSQYTTEMKYKEHFDQVMMSGPGLSRASGQDYVPYDGYRAELHRGEAVLTRQQAEEYRAGRVNGSDQAELIAAVRELGNRIERMQVTVNGRTLGAISTASASRGIAEQARERRRY